MDTEEMFRRGSDDAERGDPHPFYYQHYYHYRRGYDRTRRRFGRAWWMRSLFVAIGAAVLISIAAMASGRLSFGSNQVEAGVIMPTTVPTATPQPLFPTPTITVPTATIIVEQIIAVDGYAVVSNTEGKVLRGRAEPGLKAAVEASFPEGTRVRIVEGPVEADSLRWWRIENETGSGWSAERSAEGVVWLIPAP